MKVLLLSRYGRLGASSRVRSFQYLPFLELKGWQVDVIPLFPDNYLQAFYSRQPRGGQVVAGYWRRLKALVWVKKYDLIWIEKEIFPFMPALVERLLTKFGIPYVADYDDALFHRYDCHRSMLIRSFLGHKIDTVMRHATLVVAGNEYLAERAQAAGARRVEIVPSVVDLSLYMVKQQANNPPLVIGWIGSPSSTHCLLDITPIFESLKRDFDVQFVAVGATEEVVRRLPIEVRRWSEENEVKSIQDFDIGIMPLEESPWERGKCGYKLIQYMSCGLPVVASPVGVNKQIIDHGVNGFLARDFHEWEQVLRDLLNDQELRRHMGAKGREKVEANYSLQVQAPRLEELMRGILG